MPPSREIAGWGPIRSLLSLSPLLLFVPWFATRLHYPDGKTHAVFNYRTLLTRLFPLFPSTLAPSPCL